MQWKAPKNTKEIVWTNHAIEKMRQYRLSEQKVRSVLVRFTRKEEGIAPRTIAVMQKAGSPRRPSEIWIMYQMKKSNAASVLSAPQKIIITAWRYPGISPKRNPIPQDIADELLSLTALSRLP